MDLNAAAPSKNALIAAVKCDPTYQTWTDTGSTNESLPINCLTWYEAMAFCAWDGGYLPSDAEWGYAASGGSEQRPYPWSAGGSTAIDCTFANYGPGAFCVNVPTGGVNRVGSESPKGDGRWGHADLAGNLFEWILDGYDGHVVAHPGECDNCADLTNTIDRVLRGGSFISPPTNLRVQLRFSFGPATRNIYLGTRCARTQ